MRDFLSTDGRHHSLLLYRHRPAVSRDRGLYNSCNSFGALMTHTGRTHSVFLIVKPPNANGASFKLLGVLGRRLAGPTTGIILLSCAGHTISRVYDGLIRDGVSFLHVNSRLGYSGTFDSRLLYGHTGSYHGTHTIDRLVTGAHIFYTAASTLGTGVRLLGVGRFSLTVVSRSSRVLRPRLVKLLTTRAPAGRGSGLGVRGSVDHFILVNSRGRLPTIIRRATRRSHISRPRLRTVGLASYHLSLFRHLLG